MFHARTPGCLQFQWLSTVELTSGRRDPMMDRVRAQAGEVCERISRAEDALAEAGAELFLLGAGRVVRQAEFPHVYDANLIRRPRLRAESLDRDLAALAAPLEQIGARHLQLMCDGAALPEDVPPLLRARGFQRDPLVAMTLREEARPTRAPGVRLERVPDDRPWSEFAAVMDAMNREESWYTPRVSLEIVGSMRAKHAACALSLYVAEQDGVPVGTIGVAAHDGAASLMSVGVLPPARRRGIGATIVSDAVAEARAAGASFIYLIARANDSPKELYRRLGFQVELAFDMWLRLPGVTQRWDKCL